MRHFTTLIILYICIIGRTQVLNIDRENGDDSIVHQNIFSLNFGFSLDKQKNNLLEGSSQLENDYFFKKKSLVWISLAQTDAAFNGKTILENNGYFQMRLRDNDTRKVYPDYYIQYQWNGVWGLQNRGLVGCNARFRFWEEKKDDLYAGIGLFYEIEKWNPFLSAFAFAQDSLTVTYRKIPRLNVTAKTAFQLGKNIDFSGSTFVQFPMNEQFQHFLTPRWFIDANLYFSVNEHLGFRIHYDHNFDAYRLLPIATWYYNTSMGIQLKW